MKILILANNDMGLYKFRKELIERLCQDNEVLVALPSGEFISNLKELGCKYIPIEFNRRGRNPFNDLILLRKYEKLIERYKPQCVLTYTIKPNVYGGIACSRKRVVHYANITGLGTAVENGGILGFVTKHLYTISLRKTKCVFFQNNDNLRFFVNKGIVKGKTRLIPGSGVNVNNYKYCKYPSENESIKFLFVGRIMKDKGINELVETFRRVKENNAKCKLNIVGGCDENYEDQLKNWESEGIIKYHGLQADVRPFYADAHCVVLPSYHEGMANVMLEAASSGRPVITTNVPGCKETFDEGISGFGCDAKDINSLFNAFIKFLNLSHSEKEEMGKAGRRKMASEFDRNIVIEAYEEEIGLAK